MSSSVLFDLYHNNFQLFKKKNMPQLYLYLYIAQIIASINSCPLTSNLIFFLFKLKS